MRRGVWSVVAAVCVAGVLVGAGVVPTPSPIPTPSQDAARRIPSERAMMLAARTRSRCAEEVETLLGELVAFDTWHREGTDNAEQPPFQAMSRWFKAFAEQADLRFEDHGNVVVVSMGTASDRLGIVTHADVQPVDPSKWAADPFTLDIDSEPGRLLGRGTEDDKGSIACALVAMRELRATGWPLARRVELIISYSEESDWAPFEEFLERNPPPPLNVGFDADYPVVVAQKGWCSVMVRVPAVDGGDADVGPAAPTLASFTGGFFLSQVPEDAVARIENPTPEVRASLEAAAANDSEVRFDFEDDGDALIVRSHGTSVHSSTPEEGRNGITHLASLLGSIDWPDTTAARMVRFINDRIGTGFHAELLGDVAYSDDFMGPLTLSLGTLREAPDALVAGINLRRPAGRTNAEVEATVREAIDSWAAENDLEGLTLELSLSEPHRVHDAPHVPVLLRTFSHYTGIEDPQPISVGGGTHARMVPNGVDFGPAMPGALYTGHSEHEFITREQLLLNLEMYTSMLVDLSVK